MNRGDHERRLRALGGRRRRAEQARTAARQALAEGVREAVAAGMTQHAAARAAGITQGLVWQYLEEGTRTVSKSNMNAATFARATGIDAYAFRRWLRATGVHVGRGNQHQLPEPSSGAGQRLIARYRRP